MTTKDKKPCKKKPGFYAVYCGECGRYLCEAPASTWTYCPDCRRWSRVEPGGNDGKKDIRSVQAG
jgi:hypothetical protein